jgi:hypothetical protein
MTRLFRSALFWTAILWSSMALAQTPSPTIISGPVFPSDTLEWTIDGETLAPSDVTLEAHIYVDGTATPVLAAGYLCQPTPDGVANRWRCTVPVGVPLAALLSVRGQHSMVIKLLDKRTNVEGSASLPFRFTLPAGCADGANTRPLGFTLGERNALSTSGLSARVWMLRANGWRVEAYRAQYTAPDPPTSSGGGFWWILATCVGTPQ